MRFQPDNPLEMLLRPLAMAAPDANVYVEIMAPDFRFMFALVLLVLLAVMTVLRRRRDRMRTADSCDQRPSAAPVFVLLSALALAFVPWLATSGNGRYFAAGLLIVGPVCMGLARQLPVTRGLRLTLVAGMLALQLFAVQQSAPWRAWTMVSWKAAPYFQLEVPAQWREEPATIVTMTAISYSLVTPMFHPASRWLSLHNAPAPHMGTADSRRTETFLSRAQPGRLMLLAPALPGMMTPERLPNAAVSRAINQQLAPYRLAFGEVGACRFLASPSLADIGLGTRTAEQRAQSGFWLCQLVRPDPAGPAPTPSPRHHDAVFKALEAQCPRFFPPGGDGDSIALSNGEVRSYQQAEMKAYVYDSGEVYYKYYRALNAVLVGQVTDVLAGRAQLDCAKIRGRSGLPWAREI